MLTQFKVHTGRADFCVRQTTHTTRLKLVNILKGVVNQVDVCVLVCRRSRVKRNARLLIQLYQIDFARTRLKVFVLFRAFRTIKNTLITFE